MSRINPFDNLHFKQGLGQTEQISSPNKTNEQGASEQLTSNKINHISKSNEDDFVDASGLIDDTNDFNTSNFDFKNDDKTGEVTSAEDKDNSNQNQNDLDKKEFEELVNNFASKLLEKRN